MTELPVAILAGGLATRMRPLTETVPKSLLTVAGEPFVAHQLRLLSRAGVTRVVMCVGHLGEQIRDFVGDGGGFGLAVDYSFDGPVLLGTGGALKRALPLLGPAFFVLYGDSYLEVPYATVAATFRRAAQPALMTVYRNEGQWDTSNVVFRDGRIACYDKREKRPDMAYIDYGLGVVSAATLAAQPDAFDLAALYTRLAAQGQLAGFEVFRRFYEIGTPAGLADTERHLKEAHMATPYTAAYYEEVVAVAKGIDQAQVDAIVEILAKMRKGPGRLFVLGVGGSAGNAGHAVNDFRKICAIEAYAPTDNVSELTARTNDDGWNSVFANWLLGSRINASDVVLVFSVGGGNAEKNISANLVEALKLAKHVGAKVVGVVGRDGGYTKQVADACVVVPTVNPATITPHSEAFQAVVWHGIVTHPALLANAMKWESTR
jgi:D-sedoheptulose 7-phosphate isomerase